MLRSLEVETAQLAAQNREAEHVRLLHYWLTQRGVLSHQPEPFAIAEFEVHRVLAEASSNPFLRASTSIVEFGVAVDTLARLNPDLQAPPEGLAGLRAKSYEVLVLAVEQGDVGAAAKAMSELIS